MKLLNSDKQRNQALTDTNSEKKPDLVSPGADTDRRHVEEIRSRHFFFSC